MGRLRALQSHGNPSCALWQHRPGWTFACRCGTWEGLLHHTWAHVLLEWFGAYTALDTLGKTTWACLCKERSLLMIVPALARHMRQQLWRTQKSGWVGVDAGGSVEEVDWKPHADWHCLLRAVSWLEAETKWIFWINPKNSQTMPHISKLSNPNEVQDPTKTARTKGTQFANRNQRP